MVASYLELLASRRQGRRERGIPQILQVAETAGLAPPIQMGQAAPAPIAPPAPDLGGAMAGAMASSADAMRTAGDMRLKTRAMDEEKAKQARAQAEAQRQSEAAQQALLEAYAAGEIPEEELVRLGLIAPEQRGAFASKILDPTKGIDPLEQAKLDEEVAARQAGDLQAQAQLDLERETGLGQLALNQDAEVRAKEAGLAEQEAAAAKLAQERELALLEANAPQVLSEGQGLVDPATGQILAGIEKTPEAAETPEDLAMMEDLGYEMTPEGFAAFQQAGGAGRGAPRESEAQKIAARNTASRQMAIPDEMAGVQAQLDNANRLAELNPTAASGMTSGIVAGADKVLQDLTFGAAGVPGVDAADTEEMDARFAQSTLDAASMLKGTISDKDMQFLQDAAGKSSMTEEGRRRVIEIMQQGFGKKQRMLEAEQSALDQGQDAAAAKRAAFNAIKEPAKRRKFNPQTGELE